MKVGCKQNQLLPAGASRSRQQTLGEDCAFWLRTLALISDDSSHVRLAPADGHPMTTFGALLFHAIANTPSHPSATSPPNTSHHNSSSSSSAPHSQSNSRLNPPPHSAVPAPYSSPELGSGIVNGGSGSPGSSGLGLVCRAAAVLQHLLVGCVGSQQAALKLVVQQPPSPSLLTEFLLQR